MDIDTDTEKKTSTGTKKRDMDMYVDNVVLIILVFTLPASKAQC